MFAAVAGLAIEGTLFNLLGQPCRGTLPNLPEFAAGDSRGYTDAARDIAYRAELKLLDSHLDVFQRHIEITAMSTQTKPPATAKVKNHLA